MNDLKRVAWQFYDKGEWRIGSEYNNHEENTGEAGYAIRYLYAGDDVQKLKERIAELEAQNVNLKRLGLELEQTDHQYIDSGHTLDPMEVVYKIKKLLRFI